MLQAELALTDREEQHRGHDQHVNQRRDHAAQHRRGQWLHHLGPHARAPHDRQQAGDDGGDGHHFGAQPQQRAFHHGVPQRHAGQRAAERLPLALDRLLQVDDHHDTGLHGGPEQRNEADPDRHREVVAEEPQQVDPSGQRERDGEQHVRRFDRRPVHEVEQDEDDYNHDRNHELQPLARALLVFPAPAPAEVIAGRQGDRARHGLARLLHEAADIAALHVEQHGGEQQTVLGRDHRRPPRVVDARELSERNLRASRRADQDLRQRLRVGAILGPVADAHRESRPAFDGGGQHGLADRDLDHLLHRADADPVAGGGRTIDGDVQVLTAGDLLGIDVAGARNGTDGVSHLARQGLERRQVGAEDLDAHLRADAGGQHVDPVDDRHRPDGGHAGQLRGATHLGAQPIDRHARPPLVPRLQVDDRLGHVQRRRIGGGVGARHLGNGERDLGKGHEDGVLFGRDRGVLLERDARVGDRHEHQVALVERRHELAADAAADEQRPGEQQRGHGDGDRAMRERGLEGGPVEPPQPAHHRVVILLVEGAAKQQAAEHRHQGDRDHRGRQHRERFGEGERVEQLAFLPGEREHRDEREHDDRHREEHRPPDQPRRLQHGLPDSASIAWIHPALLDEPEGVLGDHDAGVNQDANGDRNPGQAHDVRRDAGVVHPEKGDEHGQRQRDRHDQDRPDVHQKDDVRQRHEHDFFDQRPPQRAGCLLDQQRAVIERDNLDALGQAGLNLGDPRLDRVDHRLGVDARARDDHAADGFAAALDERRDAEGVADLHVGDLFDVDRRPVRGADDDLLDVLD